MYEVLGKLATTPDSDGIIYDPSTKLVLAVSGDGGLNSIDSRERLLIQFQETTCHTLTCPNGVQLDDFVQIFSRTARVESAEEQKADRNLS